MEEVDVMSKLDEIREFQEEGYNDFPDLGEEHVRLLLAVVEAMLMGNTPDHMIAHLECYREADGWWSAEHNCTAVIGTLKELA